jgi:TonB family protein
MEAFAFYLLKSAVWLTGFAIVYFLFLLNERFFRLKRYYLVAGILISFVFPLFTFHYQVEIPAPAENIGGIIPSGNGIAPDVQTVVNDKTFDYRYLLFLVYLSGILFFAFIAVRHLSIILKAINNAKAGSLSRARVIRSPRFSGSFSFFNYVFVNPSVDDSEMEVIVDHELVHVTQKHWLDLMLAELLRMFQWVNPFAWIYSGFIKQNHEYIADEVALQQTPNPAIYKAVLVNQLFDSRIISISNSFNYSLNKKRFDMMKRIITSPYRKLKILIVLPVFAIIFYAFARPEYYYAKTSGAQLTISQAPVIIQKTVKGIVLDEDGKPLEGVEISSTGTTGNAYHTTTVKDGRFEINNVQADAFLLFFCRGYKRLTIRADLSKEMSIRMEKDPEYKAPPQRPDPLVVIDGVISEKHFSVAMKELGYNLGPVKLLSAKEATDKYGDKGANGVYEITTRKKALEMGIKSPLPKLAPEDFPTFQNQKASAFNDWVANQVKYPTEASTKQLEGWVTVNFTVELDGSLSNIVPVGQTDPILNEAVVRVIKNSPKWDPPKNPEVDSPFSTSFTVGFKLPDQVVKTPPYVVVEEMPQYPGGEMEILKFIAMNMQYPEAAKAERIEGRVIVRFIVNTEGNTEGISVLKGVHPLLDAEAVKVVSMLSGWKPGMQGGVPVNVWYMVPINFALPKTDQP